MKILKCDICGYTQDPKDKEDFLELYHDGKKYDLCKSCTNEYRQLKHDLTAAFIFYPDREIEIKISEVKKNENR